MFSKFLVNRIIRNGKDCICCLCHHIMKQCDFNVVEEHLLSDEHKRKLNQIDEEQQAKELKILLEFTESENIKIFENWITFDINNINFIRCHICDCKITGLSNTISHLDGHRHKINKKNLIISDTSQPIDELFYQTLESHLGVLDFSLKSNYIIYDEKYKLYYCTICKCKIIKTSNVTKHIEGFLHQLILDAENAVKTKSVENAVKIKSVGNASLFTEIYNCNICQVSIDNSTRLKCHIVLHLYKEFNSLRNFDLIKCELKSNEKLHLECLLCNSFLCELHIKDADQVLVDHLETNFHLDRLTIFNYVNINKKFCLREKPMNEQFNDINPEMYKPKENISLTLLCNLCFVQIPIENKESHTLEKSHIKKVSEDATRNKYTVKKTEFISEKNSDYYICFICNKSFLECSNLLTHFQKFEHQLKIIILNMINISQIKLIQQNEKCAFQCLTCKITIHGCKSFFEHMLGRKHKNKLLLPSSNLENLNTTVLTQIANELHKRSATFQNLPNVKTENVKTIENTNKLKANIDELDQFGFTTDNKQPLSILKSDMTDELLGSLISLDLNKIKKFSSNPKLQSACLPKAEDEGNSYIANLLAHGKNFIKFCINPGQNNIFNVDNENISLIKLGVTLTVPNKFKRVCIPCEKPFTNDTQILFEHLQDQEHLKNIGNILAGDKDTENYSKQYSGLRLAKLHMCVLSCKYIKCLACNIKIENNNHIIKQHTKTSIHKEKSILRKKESEQLFNQYFKIYKDIWYYAEFFYCVICDKRFQLEIGFVIHLINRTHIKKVAHFQQKGTILKFDLCHPCTTFWFGEDHYYNDHCKSDFHKISVNKNDFMIPNLNIPASEYLNNIDKNVDFLISESDKVDLVKDAKVNSLLEAILEAVKPIYSDAKAYVFGSRLSNLGFPDSDVDIFLDCNNVYYKSSTKQNLECLKSMHKCIEKTPNIWKVDEVLISTRIPILKLRHLPSNLKCDVSFVNGLSVEKSKLLRIYNDAFPGCRKSILFMKKWLTLCRLFGSDCITTFAISWYVIFYFQLQGILPSVYELIKNKRVSKIVDGWECGFEKITIDCCVPIFGQKY
ncbi:uncharacterized protein LOC131671880 isoform X2 [Phymastichus coffea]|uniref:uncharacterized protein LOC131671880 isoform X2 n=1 Tax=Phymastichus coffea TaxID=108790 RepID=UPI00273CAB4D|nr:uncharacterized protein LOC131671880 isoform X2 [Phymastichus coffea]